MSNIDVFLEANAAFAVGDSHAQERIIGRQGVMVLTCWDPPYEPVRPPPLELERSDGYRQCWRSFRGQVSAGSRVVAV